MATSTHRIPESETAIADKAIVKFRETLLAGASSPVMTIDDAVVVVTMTEIVAGPRAELLSHIDEATTARLDFGRQTTVSYADLYHIFFGEMTGEEMQRQLNLSMILLRLSDRKVEQGLIDEANDIVRDLDIMVMTPMLVTAMAWLKLKAQ
ncbi:hypothetical protein ASD54_08745 [Rhizobium sp. Root149]|uniref:hypothetical protein n=1 Tax=Rhizobium sp. Root149 TaxID=1736473 RepID=UPI0007152F49|nr:hypothetical protein [Rhizobium sp. Root149]KQZ50333.1 hypothetical protein ASD54_08745 [Rhizobium sp. Root149]